VTEVTEVTRLAAAALAIREALERLGDDVREVGIGLVLRVSAESDSDVRTVGRVVADVEKRFEISIELDFEGG
jgi:hypothetical protein